MNRLLLAAMTCCASILAGLLMPRRRGWRGTYEQPIPPRTDLDREYLWAERGRRIG